MFDMISDLTFSVVRWMDASLVPHKIPGDFTLATSYDYPHDAGITACPSETREPWRW